MRFGMGLSPCFAPGPARQPVVDQRVGDRRSALLGAAGERIGYDRVEGAVKRRRSQGLMLYHHLPNWPEDRRWRRSETCHGHDREVFGVI